jgi:hypothetical protein
VLRGEVYPYRPVVARPGASLLRLILSADGWNADPDHRIVMGAHVQDHDRGGLVNVPTALGWVSLTTVEPVLRSRLEPDPAGRLTPVELDAVTSAFRALFDV